MKRLESDLRWTQYLVHVNTSKMMAANQHNSVNLVDEAIEKGHQEQK
jgi:hypothetical protein